MRVPAFIILASLTVAAEAQHIGKHDQAKQIAPWEGWHEHVSQVADLRVHSPRPMM
jgi:hypothetical protein